MLAIVLCVLSEALEWYHSEVEGGATVEYAQCYRELILARNKILLPDDPQQERQDAMLGFAALSHSGSIPPTAARERRSGTDVDGSVPQARGGLP